AASGPTPTPINTRANRFDATSKSRYVNTDDPHTTPPPSGSAATAPPHHLTTSTPTTHQLRLTRIGQHHIPHHHRRIGHHRRQHPLKPPHKPRHRGGIKHISGKRHHPRHRRRPALTHSGLRQLEAQIKRRRQPV